MYLEQREYQLFFLSLLRLVAEPAKFPDNPGSNMRAFTQAPTVLSPFPPILIKKKDEPANCGYCLTFKDASLRLSRTVMVGANTISVDDTWAEHEYTASDSPGYIPFTRRFLRALNEVKGGTLFYVDEVLRCGEEPEGYRCDADVYRTPLSVIDIVTGQPTVGDSSIAYIPLKVSDSLVEEQNGHRVAKRRIYLWNFKDSSES